MWGLAELDHRRPDLNPAAGRQVRDADIEVDVKLVAGKGPTVAVAGDGGGRPRVYDGQLRIRTRTAIGGPAAASDAPSVAFEAVDGIEANFGQYLPLVYGRSPDDQLERPRVRRRLADVIEALLQRGEVDVLQHAEYFAVFTPAPSFDSRGRESTTRPPAGCRLRSAALSPPPRCRLRTGEHHRPSRP